MPQRKRLKKFARSTIIGITASKKVPIGLRQYWQEQLAKKPTTKHFTMKKRR